jgi:Zn-dependent protease
MRLIIGIPVILFSLTVHEFCHAFAAYLRGDPTAKNMGRMTLNPIAHLDPIGTVLLFVSFLQGFGIGWAKPVPVNPSNFSNKKMDDFLVSAAGPGSNFILAVISSLIIRFGHSWIGEPITFILSIAAIMNFGLGFFNLLPIPPLDGSHILFSVLPDNISAKMYNLKPYQMITALIIVVIVGFYTIAPVSYFFFNFIAYGVM